MTETEKAIREYFQGHAYSHVQELVGHAAADLGCTREEAQEVAEAFKQEILEAALDYDAADHRAALIELRDALRRTAHGKRGTSRYRTVLPLNPHYVEGIDEMRWQARAIDDDLAAPASGVTAEMIVGVLLRADALQRSGASGHARQLHSNLPALLTDYVAGTAN